MHNIIAIIFVLLVFVSQFYFWRWILGRKLANRNEVNLPAILLAFVSGIALIFLFVLFIMSGTGC